MVDNKCTGKSIQVHSDRTAEIEILSHEDDGVIAIHVQVIYQLLSKSQLEIIQIQFKIWMSNQKETTGDK